MADKIIRDYINNYLYLFLKSYKLNDDIISIVSKDIKFRLASILDNWNDIEFRETILFTGLEEALTYKPDADLKIKQLVVVAIRNSLIENLHSSDKKTLQKFSLNKEVLDNSDIKLLTKQAIKYFSKIDFNKIDKVTFLYKNLYKDLKNKYPVSWTAISNLALNSTKYISYSKIKRNKKDAHTLLFNNCNNITSSDKKYTKIDVLSGMNEDLGNTLYMLLNSIVHNKLDCLFFYNFKSITRNLNKLFKVLEIVLLSDKEIVTPNFYISNGYVSKRKNLFSKDKCESFIDLIIKDNSFFSGITKTHYEKLKQIKDDLMKVS